jgi:DNA-binding NtrC family response regulator
MRMVTSFVAVSPILVVEDDEAIRSLLASLLMRNGYAVDLARDGVEAIEKLTFPRRYTALVLDFAMPRADGGKVLEHLIDVDPEMLGRTVVITGHPDYVHSMGLSSVCEVMSKPIQLPRLLAMIGQLGHSPQPPPSPDVAPLC